MADQSVRVEIGGRAYQLGGADPQRTRELAHKVDETISRFEDTLGPGADKYQLAILAALQIADELATARDGHAQYRTEVAAAVRKMLDDLQSGIADIDDEVAALRAQEPSDEPD